MPSTLLLASGRGLASGLTTVFVLAAGAGLATVVALAWTTKLVRTRTALEPRQRRVLFRLGWLLLVAGLAAVGAWLGLGAKVHGDNAKLIPLAVVFLGSGAVALRRARKPADSAPE